LVCTQQGELHDFAAYVVCQQGITESQNVRAWEGPLWVTESNPPAEAGSLRVGSASDAGKRLTQHLFCEGF